MNIAILAPGFHWVSAARLPRALKAAGFSVYVCCPRGSLLTTTRFVDATVEYDVPFAREGIFIALEMMHERWGIDVILPGDDTAIGLLHGFVDAGRNRPEAANSPLPGIIARSLGDECFYPQVLRRSALASLGSVPGLTLPRQVACTEADNLFALAAAIGYPVVLKMDFTSGGLGVRGMASEDDLTRFVEANAIFERHGPRDARPQPGHRFVVQEWIRGAAAATSLSAVGGRVLASFSYRRVHAKPEPFGPTSVAEVIEDRALADAAAALVAHFGFTGIGGVDFVIAEATGTAYALEFNARPTLTSHLGPLMGADLCAAFHRGLSGQSLGGQGLGGAPAAHGPRQRLVAIFPLEWQRDPRSPYLHGAYHDVPWDDPDLLRALVAPPPVPSAAPEEGTVGALTPGR